MIMLGADSHKSSHTIAVVNSATGQILADKTIRVGARGFAALLIWARALKGDRVWALEDCRHVSGARSSRKARTASRRPSTRTARD
jgi:transposase